MAQSPGQSLAPGEGLCRQDPAEQAPEDSPGSPSQPLDCGCFSDLAVSPDRIPRFSPTAALVRIVLPRSSDSQNPPALLGSPRCPPSPLSQGSGSSVLPSHNSLITRELLGGLAHQVTLWGCLFVLRDSGRSSRGHLSTQGIRDDSPLSGVPWNGPNPLPTCSPAGGPMSCSRGGDLR